jgi:hypothetical protein
LPALSAAGASLTPSCSVSTPRSSNRTGAANASGSRRKVHEFAHGKLRGRVVRRTSPSTLWRWTSGNRPSAQPTHLVFGAQPLTKPLASVLLHRPVGFTDRTQTEVVGPPIHHAVELSYHNLCIQQGCTSSSLAADRVTDTRHPLLGRHPAQIGPPRFRRVAASKRLSYEFAGSW